MNWEKLVNSKIETACRGFFFQTKGKYPHENLIELMIIEDTESPSGLSLVVTSGYKAGTVFQSFPIEALSENTDYPSISIFWLKNNWSKWVYQTSIKDVFISPPKELK